MIIALISIIASDNLLKQIISLGILQVSVMLFYISICYHSAGSAPIIINSNPSIEYVNPLPQVLMLTAIVVGLATTTLGLAMVIKMSKIKKSILVSEIKNHN